MIFGVFTDVRCYEDTRNVKPADGNDYRKHGIGLRLSAAILNPGSGQMKATLVVIDLSLTGADY